MRLLLIAPSNRAKNEAAKSYRKPFVLYPKYNLLLLAGLTPTSWEISIIDESIEDIDINTDVDLIGITVTTSKANRAYEIADTYRSKGIKVVLGGVHPSILPYEAIEHADSVVIGEAEYTWPILLDDFCNNSLKKFYTSEKRHDLINLPYARRNLVKRQYYRRPDVIETSRGCPHNCEYCCTKFFGNRYRYRPVDEVVREIASIQSDYAVFMDDNLLGNRERAKELLSKLIPLKKQWTAQCTINIADDLELVRLAAKSGCQNLVIGFDTLNSQNLVITNKKFNDVNRYEESIKILCDHGIRVAGNFIFGFDDDDESVFENTVRFVERNKLNMPSFWILTPYPGTALYKRLLLENRIIDYNWDNYDSRHVVFKPRRISVEKLQEGYWNAYKGITSLRSICKRTFNLQKNFPRRLTFNLILRRMAKQGITYYVE